MCMNIYFDGWVSAGAESTVYTFLIIFVNISTPSVAGLAQGISTFFPLFFLVFCSRRGFGSCIVEFYTEHIPDVSVIVARHLPSSFFAPSCSLNFSGVALLRVL
jgi:hypothetical protein